MHRAQGRRRQRTTTPSFAIVVIVRMVSSGHRLVGCPDHDQSRKRAIAASHIGMRTRAPSNTTPIDASTIPCVAIGRRYVVIANTYARSPTKPTVQRTARSDCSVFSSSAAVAGVSRFRPARRPTANAGCAGRMTGGAGAPVARWLRALRHPPGLRIAWHVKWRTLREVHVRNNC